MNVILKEKDGKFILPKGWTWRNEGESIRRGDKMLSYHLSEWEYSNADWWGKKIEPLQLVIRRIR